MAFDPDLLESARKTFAGPVAFLKSAPKLDFLPDAHVPEIAFAGRSNVGKSSLLNALAGRKALARTSVTPGRTQELNFFDVGDPPRLPAGRHAGLRLRQGAEGRGQAVALPHQRFPARPAGTEARTGADRFAPRHQGCRSRHSRDARQGRRQLPPGADQGGQDQADRACRRRPAHRRGSPQAPRRAPDILETSSETGLGIPELRAAVIEAIG